MSHTSRSATDRLRLLILSFSPIDRDARVLKQVRMGLGRYEVTTCGFGPAPNLAGQEDTGGVARLEHVEIHHSTLPGRSWDALLQARAYRAGYWLMPDVRAAARALRGRHFDLILADDIDALPLALSLRPRYGVHADLHEYFPRLNEEHEPWRRRIGPWYTWLCRRYLPKAGSVTTVSRAIAQEYHRQFGPQVGVVTNATPYWDLTPTPVGDPIRLVHSGTSHRERNLVSLIDGVLAVPGFTLDLYLTPNDPPHLAELRELSAHHERIRVHDPVPYAQLIPTLNRYDLGVHLLPPVNFNFANALPNKIFDFAQARLGAVIGPSPAMAEVVTSAGYGVVAPGYSGADLARVLRGLDRDQVAAMKAAAHAHAHELSAQSEVPKWQAVLEALVERGREEPR